MAKVEKSTRARRYKRITLWSMAIILLGAMVLPLGGYVYTGIQAAQAQAVKNENPRANYWRAVRGGDSGYSAVTGTRQSDGAVINGETNRLMNADGQNWRQIRNGYVANYGGWILFLVLIAILLFFVKFGRVELEGGRSGETVVRWSAWERFVHWVTAISFIILAISGLSLLFGRILLIPLMGPAGFAAYAGLAKGLHNFVGPWFFTPGVALMIIMWIAHNIPTAEDVEWFAKGGGLIGKEHPSAGRMNGGEKVWFWFICTVGVVSIVTGFLLNFQAFFELGRYGMQTSLVVHGISALAFIAFWLGHAYIGSIGSEASLEAMTTGEVDVNWAKQHHDRWYEELQEQGAEGGEAQNDPSSVVNEQPA